MLVSAADTRRAYHADDAPEGVAMMLALTRIMKMRCLSRQRLVISYNYLWHASTIARDSGRKPVQPACKSSSRITRVERCRFVPITISHRSGTNGARNSGNGRNRIGLKIPHGSCR